MTKVKTGAEALISTAVDGGIDISTILDDDLKNAMEAVKLVKQLVM